MIKYDIVLLNKMLEEAGDLRIKDNRVGYKLYQVRKEVSNLFNSYREYVTSNQLDSDSERDFLMQEEETFITKIKGLEDALLESNLDIPYTIMGNLIDALNDSDDSDDK